MNRRYFFQSLASGLFAACSPGLFLPKLIKPAWKSLLPVPVAPEGLMFLSYTLRVTANGFEVVDTSGFGPQPVAKRPTGAFAVTDYTFDGNKVSVTKANAPAEFVFHAGSDLCEWRVLAPQV